MVNKEGGRGMDHAARTGHWGLSEVSWLSDLLTSPLARGFFFSFFFSKVLWMSHRTQQGNPHKHRRLHSNKCTQDLWQAYAVWQAEWQTSQSLETVTLVTCSSQTSTSKRAKVKEKMEQKKKRKWKSGGHGRRARMAQWGHDRKTKAGKRETSLVPTLPSTDKWNTGPGPRNPSRWVNTS